MGRTSSATGSDIATGAASCFALVLLTCSAARAESHLFYFGGGGEDRSVRTTFFDKSLDEVGLLEERGWRVKAWWAGPDHTLSKQRARRILGRDIPDFTSGNFRRAVTELQGDILRGRFGRGDQVLVIVDTHGTQASSNMPMGEWSTYDGSVPRDILMAVTNAANSRGVLLGVLDNSCFGGISSGFAGANVCAVSVTSSSRVGRIYHGYKLLHFLARVPTWYSSHSLEALYLSARRADDRTPTNFMPHQWQISTALGEMAADALEPFNQVAFGDETIDAAGETRAESVYTMNPTDFAQIRVVLGTLAAMGVSTHEINWATLERQIVDYNNIRRRLNPVFQGTICVGEGDRRSCLGRMRVAYCAVSGCLKEIMGGSSRELRDLGDLALGYRDYFARLRDLARGISQAERILYQKLYDSGRPFVRRGPGPCERIRF